MDKDRIVHDFAYHKPTSEKVGQHEAIRDVCADLAHTINIAVPDCREKSLAITKIEEAMFWANAAVARNPRGPESN